MLGSVDFYKKTFNSSLSDSIQWSRNLVCISSSIPEISRGDRLVEIGGKEVNKLSDLHREISLYEEGEGVVYRVEKPSGKRTLQFVLLKRVPVSLSYIFMSVVGFFSLFIGFFLFFRIDVEEVKEKFLVLVSLLFSLYVFSTLSDGSLMDSLFYFLRNFSLWFFPPYFLFFFSLFPHRIDFKWKKLMLFSLPSLLFSFQSVIYIMSGKIPFGVFLKLKNILGALQYFSIAFYSFLSVLFLIYLLFKVNLEKERAQIKWVLTGIAIAILPFIFFYLIPSLTGKQVGQLGELSIAFQIFLPLSFLSSLTKFRLPDVDILLKKGIAFTISFLIVLTLFLFFAIRFFPSEKRGLAIFSMAATVFIAILVFPILYQKASELIDRVFYRKSFFYRTHLVEISKEIAAEKEWLGLGKKLTETLSRALSSKGIAFYGFNGKDYELIGKNGKMRSPLKMKTPALIPGYIKLWKFSRKDKEMGFLLLAPKERGKFYNVEDYELLEFVSPYIGLALENSLLYTNLKKRAKELEELKEFNESIVESLSVALVITNGVGNILRMNENAEKNLNRDEIELLIKNELLFSKEERNYERWIKNREGEKRLFSIMKTSFKVAKGYIFLFEDTTENFMLQQRLITSEKLASLGVLIAGIAHEINTPITGIMSYIEMLSEGLKGEKMEYVEKIQAQIKRIMKTVRSLLNFSRRTHEEFVRANLIDIIKDVVEVLGPQIKKKGVDVIIDGKVWGYVNPDRMQQVFFNLFSNSLEAMNEGGKIRIKASEEDGTTKIEFSDTGKGIPKDALDKIYDPFFSTRPGGTGLGLSITFAIIKEHGGEIEVVRSEEGKGTTFLITLPSWRQYA